MVTPARLLQTGESVPLSEITWDTVFAVVLVVGVSYVMVKLVNVLMLALANRLHVRRFRVTLLIPIVEVAVYAAAAYVIVMVALDPSQEQLIAFAGLFGAALGFGFKELVTDVLGGLAILFERPYRIGDQVSIGDHYGEVVDIGLRSTRLQTLDDDLVTIPNHVFFADSIVNGNDGNAEMLLTVDFYVDHDTDPSVAARIVEEGITTSQYVYVTDDHPVSIRLEASPYYYTITGKAYVNDLRNETAFKTDITKRVLAAFDGEEIESPQPPQARALEAAV